MTQYKIQVGSWTKLPNGKVQEDTREIMEMMGKVCNVNLEVHVSDVGDWWEHVGVLNEYHSTFSVKSKNGSPHVATYDVSSDKYVIAHEPSLFIPYEGLQKMLNTPEVNVTSLLNTKLDCRKADGTVDEELSRAFQEACFEQGILWCAKHNEIRYIDEPFLYAEEGCLYYTDDDSSNYFENQSNKQINFKYSRTLTWEATEVPTKVEEDEMVDICGVEYSAKELSEALALIKAARKGILVKVVDND